MNSVPKFCLKTFVIWKPWYLKLSHVCHHHLIKVRGNWHQWYFRWIYLGVQSFWVFGIDPQRIPRYPCRWHVTLGILSPQVRIIHTKTPNKLKQRFKSVFQMLGNCFTSLGTLAYKPCNLAVADLYNFPDYQPNFV